MRYHKRDKYKEDKELVARLYKNSKGEPFRLTDGQAELFDLIFKKRYPRNHIMTFTRYGKSDVTSMAVLTRVATFPEKWAIVAGKESKAHIIMDDVIGHIYDNNYTATRMIRRKGETDQNIRRYRNKRRINFNLGNGLMGELFICSAKEAMGFGAPNIVEDEAALIPDTEHALVMRMLGDQPKNFLVKIGNPWESKHFRDSYKSKKYHKFVVDYKQGIREGRIKPEYVEEMRKQPFFDILYEVKFPPEGSVDREGWRRLLLDEEIEPAMKRKVQPVLPKVMGVDIGGGGDANAFLIRTQNYAYVKEENHEPDVMATAGRILSIAQDERIYPEDIFIDAVGIGEGVWRRLEEQGYHVNPIKVGEKAINNADFYNLRAEIYWKLREWVLQGGTLANDDRFYELSKIRYKEDSGRRVRIESKQNMRKRGEDSPNIADALALTFAPRTHKGNMAAAEPLGGIKPYYPDLGF